MTDTLTRTDPVGRTASRRTNSAMASDVGAAAHDARTAELARLVAAQWPPERHDGVRLAHARRALTHGGDDPHRHAILARHLDVAEAAARAHLDGADHPPRRQARARRDPRAAEETRWPRVHDEAAGSPEARARARARAALAGMLDPNPQARAAATRDLTVHWPADHLRLMARQAEHARRRLPVEDPVARAAAAVAAIPDPVLDETDARAAEGFTVGHHTASDVEDADTDAAVAMIRAGGSR